MKGLRPFFSYYGGKWRAALHYPAPEHPVIVEPFAGSAGYSLRHPEREVRLFDIDPIVAGVWDYLIHAPSAEVLALPVEFDHVDDLTVPDEARHLIGFWLNKGGAAPCKTPSAWMRAGTHNNSFWGHRIRQRIASQQAAIRHWTITCGSYVDILDEAATYYVDPPYAGKVGRHYRFDAVDFAHLAEWCQSRRGQVIVCEQAGADWLPFEPLRSIKSTRGTSAEVVWLNEPRQDLFAHLYDEAAVVLRAEEGNRG